MKKLDQQEKELIESVESGEWRTVQKIGRERERFRSYAEETYKKNRRINIRISSRDLNALQKRALEEGIPYQTLISSLLHKYVSGRLVEKESITSV